MAGPTGAQLLIPAVIARRRSKATCAATVDAAGLERLNMSHTRNIDPERVIDTISYKPQVSSRLIQASSPKLQASSLKPQAASCFICVPWKSFRSLWTSDLTKMNVFFGCMIWKAIWWGENLILLAEVAFNSTVKKCWLLLYPNRSGVPSKLVFSSLVHLIWGVFLLSSS